MGGNQTQQGVVARDGLHARRSGIYANEKLSFIDRFVPAALTATRKKHERYYVDLFAGPGMNVTDGGDEFPGAVIRALTLHGASERDRFSHMIVANKEQADFDALRIRLDQRIGRREIRIPLARMNAYHVDSNVAAPTLLGTIPRGAYAFVFLDPESPGQLPWTTIDVIARHAPWSTDLYILYPDDMGVNRRLAYTRTIPKRAAVALTAYYGTDDWAPLVERRWTRSQAPALRRELAELYQHQLEQHWEHVRCARHVVRTGNQRLYKMFICTRHAVALKLIDHEIETHARAVQLQLGLKSA